MMCSVYGICKVSEHDIKFKDIVKAYGTQPHAEPQVINTKCNYVDMGS